MYIAAGRRTQLTDQHSLVSPPSLTDTRGRSLFLLSNQRKFTSTQDRLLAEFPKTMQVRLVMSLMRI